jgi:hypothetical protein
MLMCCVCAFLLHRESPDIIVGDELLVLELVLSQLFIRARLGLNTHQSI